MQVPRVRCKTLGERTFAHAGPTVWNALPLSLRTCEYELFEKKDLRPTFLGKRFIRMFVL